MLRAAAGTSVAQPLHCLGLVPVQKMCRLSRLRFSLPLAIPSKSRTQSPSHHGETEEPNPFRQGYGLFVSSVEA